MYGGKNATQDKINDLTKPQLYYGLKQAWKGYQIARVKHDKAGMIHYNEGIQKFKKALNYKTPAKPMPKNPPQFVNGLRVKEGKKFVVEGII
jgi:hypothetical protein